MCGSLCFYVGWTAGTTGMDENTNWNDPANTTTCSDVIEIWAMQKRTLWLLLSSLLASTLLNIFLLLWNTSQDRVTRVSREQIEALALAADRSGAGSANWSRVLTRREDLVIVEEGQLVSFRGLFTNDTQYTISFWKRSSAGTPATPEPVGQ